MSLFNKFFHTAHCSCKQSQHRPLKVVLEIYYFFGVGHKCCKIGPQLFPTTLHLVIYISNLWMSLSKSKCWYSNNCLHFLMRVVPLRQCVPCLEKGNLKREFLIFFHFFIFTGSVVIKPFFLSFLLFVES